MTCVMQRGAVEEGHFKQGQDPKLSPILINAGNQGINVN